MSEHYILDNRKVVPVDLMTWARAMESQRKEWRAGDTKIGGVRVSTVFLGLDHRFGDEGPPLLFETMIFGGKHDDFQSRCSTWDEAEAMHASAVALASQP